MSIRLPLPAEVLRGPRPAPHELEGHSNAAVHRLLDLADRGDYLEAAEEAVDLLRDCAGDPRLQAIYLMGYFVERGVVAMPDLLAGVEGVLDLGRSSANARDARRSESAIEWLFRAVAERIAFHTKRRDEIWRSWVETVSPEQIDEIAAKSERLLARSPPGSTMLYKIARWSRDKLAPAASRIPRAPPPVEADADAPPTIDPRGADDWDQPEPEAPRPQEPATRRAAAPEPGEEDAAEEGASDFEDDHPYDYEDDESDDPRADFEGHRFDPREGGPAFARRTPSRIGPAGVTHSPPPSESDLDSPALSQLRQKIRGFEVVVERGDYAKAAVIASDIQGALERFDPLTYLPRLFARYLKLLRRNLEEIEAHWRSEGSTASRVLEQLYRADLEGFVDE